MRKTILFDLDGTLIDSTPAILNSFQYAFKELQLKTCKDEDIKALIGFPLDVMFSTLHPDYKHLSQKFIEFYRIKYKEVYLEQTSLLPSVKDALELAKEFSDLGVVTTKGGLFTKPLLDFLGILHFFEVIIGRDDVQFPKPHSEPIIKALDKMQKDKTNAYMVGDTHLDILSAKSAEIIPVAVCCGYESKENLSFYTENIKNSALDAVIYIKNK